MGSSKYTVGAMVDTVEQKLQDEDNGQWLKTDLVNLYNLVLRKISSMKPESYSVTTTMLLAVGVKQAIPSVAFGFDSITRNMGTDGATDGNGVRETNIELLTTWLPDWSGATATTDIKHFMRGDNMPDRFYCYPPSDGTGYVELIYYRIPPTTTYDADGEWENEIIPLSDQYVDTIMNGILYMAYDDDSDLPGNAPRSEVYFQRFLASLQMKSPAKGSGGTP